MKAVLSFIKTHAISLACGVAAVAFVVVAMMTMSDKSVVKAMESAMGQAGASSIAGLRGSPKNPALIEAEKRRAATLEEEFAKARAEMARINKREPMMGGVFPKPERATTPIEFKETYKLEVRKLPALMSAGTLPTDAEYLEEQEVVQSLRELEDEKQRELQVDEGGRQPVAPPTARAQPAPPQLTGGGRFAGGGPALMGGRGGRTAGGAGAASPGLSPVGPNTEPKFDWQLRARVNKAKSIQAYIDPVTLHVSDIVDEMGAPPVESMWFAQVGYWLQQDICRAIADLNKAAAARSGASETYVEHSPIKRVTQIRLQGYVLPTGNLLPFALSRDSGALPSEGPPASFTRRKSNEQYDVIRFRVQMVVDQRSLLDAVDGLTKANFFQCVNLGYEPLDRAVEEQNGYFYGTAPLVLATMDFEAYMARELYRELMPESVAKLLSGQQ